ncbi:hypothetical protein ccbrp13_36900 [Ktedonobacteria bacterium brp13]|jgi:hypothetical protein|nr:hypothetical protein ccbrp13_36900 [Ktedonobacteria bacterium brp13]
MALAKDERDRILNLIEAGQISANDAARLLDTLENDTRPARPLEAARERTIRLRIHTLNQQQRQQNYIVSLPLSMLRASLRLGSYILPQLSSELVTEALAAIATSQNGRLLDIQDLEQGERIEIFVE